MALDLGGRHDEARARVRLAAPSMQRADGAWHAYYLGNEVEDPALDTNVTCYIANGVWHHYLVTGDTAFLAELLADGRARHRLRARPPARDGRDRVAGRRPRRRRAAHRLVEHPPSACACAIAIAERLGHERPDWELSLGSLAIALAHRPDVFLDKDRWAMDWYYPILGGVLRGHAADARVASKLGDVRGRGPRRALRVRPAVGHRGRDVRAGHGARRHRRHEHACDALRRGCSSCAPTAAATGPAPTSTTTPSTATASSIPPSSPRGTRPRSCSRRTRSPAPVPPPGLFRGEGLPAGLTADELLEAGVEIAEERARK